MKLISILVFILITLTQQVNSQDYWPYKGGDNFYTWNYRYYFCSNGTYYEKYYVRQKHTINDSLVNQGDKYYKYNGNYYYYSKSEKKLYVLYFGVKSLAMDFNKYTGSDTLYFDGKKRFYNYKGDSTIVRNGKTIKIFRAEFKKQTDSYNRYYLVFAENIGLFEYFANNAWSISTLYACMTDTINTTVLYKNNTGIISLNPIPQIESIISTENNYAIGKIDNSDIIGIDGIQVERKREDEFNFSPIAFITSGNNFYDNTIIGGKKYIYRLRGSIDGYDLELSSEYTHYAICTPINFRQDTLSEGIKLKWGLTSNLCDSFLIERSTQISENVWSEFATAGYVNKNTFEYSEGNFNVKGVYKYRIKTVYNMNKSYPSSEIIVYPKVLLQGIGDFYAVYGSDENIHIHWQNRNSFPIKTVLQKKEKTASVYTNLLTSYVNNNSYDDLNISEYKKYDYRIFSYFNEFSYNYTDTITVVVPKFQKPIAPSNFTVIKLSENKTKLSWEYYMPYLQEFILKKKYHESDPITYIFIEKSIREYVDNIEVGSSQVIYELTARSRPSVFSDPVKIVVVLTSIDEENKLNSFGIEQNYPNPFNPITNIKVNLPEAGIIKLSVYNMLGEEVMQIINGYLEAGSYTYTIDAGKLSSGTYLYKLSNGKENIIKKMILLK